VISYKIVQLSDRDRPVWHIECLIGGRPDHHLPEQFATATEAGRYLDRLVTSVLDVETD
jgi:hypothetical protein